MGPTRQWRKRNVLQVARRQRENAENKLKELVGSRIKPRNWDIKAIHLHIHSLIHYCFQYLGLYYVFGPVLLI